MMPTVYSYTDRHGNVVHTLDASVIGGPRRGPMASEIFKGWICVSGLAVYFVDSEADAVAQMLRLHWRGAQ